VIRRFERAAIGYESEARIQESVAGTLDEWLTGLSFSRDMQRGLEIGCGSGLLTRRLLRRWPSADWIVSDIAPAMVRQCASSFHGDAVGRTCFMAGDGEDPACFPGSYDLIVANLAVQWFEKPLDSVRGLAGKLDPGGWLVFSTLGDRSFETLRSRSGLSFYDYPSAADWEAELAGWSTSYAVDRHSFIESASDLRSFLREWKQLGASTPPGRRPVTRSELRQAILRSDSHASELLIEYEILFVAVKAA
jgi:malonyl-CoA O-methyltransferase